jgi:hypothetical protein
MRGTTHNKDGDKNPKQVLSSSSHFTVHFAHPTVVFLDPNEMRGTTHNKDVDKDPKQVPRHIFTLFVRAVTLITCLGHCMQGFLRPSQRLYQFRSPCFGLALAIISPVTFDSRDDTKPPVLSRGSCRR